MAYDVKGIDAIRDAVGFFFFPLNRLLSFLVEYNSFGIFLVPCACAREWPACNSSRVVTFLLNTKMRSSRVHEKKNI
jgi:hypothetical protein